MNTLLFLCTGNYYRSRFAEIIFNHLAPKHQLPWQATSAGLRVIPNSPHNPGPLSIHAHTALLARGIPLLALLPLSQMGNGKSAMGDPLTPIPDPPIRFPRQVSEADLAAAHLTIALKESEHRPLMTTLHAHYADKITYWNIHDLDCSAPGEALTQLETELHALIQTLTQTLPKK